ncbi:hypothetical protein FJZ31_27275 [Candidatus Poribacteria bacterium]|nr:hypothetical protein [Candidatus Poribacteria bacterium]
MQEERYETYVPDTLDLADRASLAINALTGALDPERSYEIYFVVRFSANPPYMYHDTTGLPTNNPKFAESLPLMRVMSGSDKNLDIENGMINSMVSLIAEDGLYYAKASKERPWHEGVGHVYRTPDGQVAKQNEDFANVYGNSRMMLAMMARYQKEQDTAWKSRISKMADRMIDIAQKQEEYAYYPDSGIGEAFSFPKSGWTNTDEPVAERMGAEGSMFMYHCGPIRAMSRWYNMSEDERALEFAGKLVNFVLKPNFWGAPTAEPNRIVGAEHGHFTGHHHGHVAMFRGLLEYAIATNNTRIKEFVRDGYEYARNFGISRIGLFGEACSTADMVAMAIKLADAGVGDYWEDVDQYVRNQLVEYQLLRKDFLKEVALASPQRAVSPPQETADRVIERNLGGFAGDYNNPTKLTNTWIMQCCTGNATQALYYAWEGIVRCHSGIAQVNLLLNRVSPWLDVSSYLPYEGKVILKNKKAEKLCVRIPRWVDKKAVQCHKGGERLSPFWLGNYVVFEKLAEQDEVTIEFPVEAETVKYTQLGKEYTCYFKGNTLVDISPRDEGIGYPIYLREHYKKDRAPMKRVTRYVSPVIIEW